MELERVVRLTHAGRVFAFTVEDEGALAFWNVAIDGRTHALPLRATGDEQPEFFRAAAELALRQGAV